MHNLIGKLFNTCYKAFYNDSKHFSDPNNVTNKKTINNFLNRLKKAYNINSIGENWLRHYFRFQFNYWLDKETDRRITLQWVLGKKAFDRYEKIDNWEQVNYHIEKNTSFITFENEKNERNLDYENQQRSKYLNQDIGLLWCIENTSLYDKCSPCFRCKFKQECKELLKANYPNLYKSRGLND